MSDTRPPQENDRRRGGRWGRWRLSTAFSILLLLMGGLAACDPVPPTGRSVDLKVLVVSTGDRATDAGLELMARTLDQIGVPYDVLDSSTTTLTDAMLFTGNRGHYNGIIITQADLFTPTGSGFTLEEWQRLHAYERDFKVQESVISGFPATDPSRDLDYGMGTTGGQATTVGRWANTAGTRRMFGYVNTANALLVEEWSVWGVPRNDGTGPTVVPLLVDDANPDHVLVSRLVYPDGRQVLLSTVGNAWYRLHSNVLAYQFLDFATKGLFIGGRYISLATHVDDMFLADDLWDPVANQTDFNQSYRMTPADVDAAIAAQNAFRAEHPLASDWMIEFPFNGSGANPADPLTQRVLQDADEFSWINHTYNALQMDRLCPDPDEPQPPECPVTPYEVAYDDIAQNRVAWQQLGLPGYTEGLQYLLSDSHAGLHDRQGTEEDPSDDIPFPEGANPNFLQAAQDLGVRYIASDSSRPNQDREQRVPGFDLFLLPRYPTNVYVNAHTPELDTDEYNWIYYERYIAQGQDPCTVPGAICAPRSYEEILDAEADFTVNHMLSGKEWPHYFHQSNLHAYEGNRSLLLDWMDAVMTRYEQIFTLPVRTPLAPELGPAAEDRIVAAEQNVRGWLDIDTGQVTLLADGPANPLVTGIVGGEVYGGNSISKVAVSAAPRTFTVDPANAG
jgi:hypothetical protein